MVTSAAAAAEEAAVEDATLDAVELEEPPQAARPSAAAPTPAAFRKLRREIRFILCCLHHFVPFKHSRANRLCPKDCVFFCIQYKFFRFLAQEVCCFIFYRYCFLKNSSSKSAKNLLKVSAQSPTCNYFDIFRRDLRNKNIKISLKSGLAFFVYSLYNEGKVHETTRHFGVILSECCVCF